MPDRFGGHSSPNVKVKRIFIDVVVGLSLSQCNFHLGRNVAGEC